MKIYVIEELVIHEGSDIVACRCNKEEAIALATDYFNSEACKWIDDVVVYAFHTNDKPNEKERVFSAVWDSKEHKITLDKD